MATVHHLRVSDEAILAEYVELDDFKGLLQQRLAIGPDTLAVLIKDGEIATAGAGAHLAVGGLLQAVKDAIGGRHAIRLLIADLKPFQLPLAARAITKDDVEIACEFALDFQVNPEQPLGVLGLMSTASALPKANVLKRVTAGILERALFSAVRRVTALELRGNNGLQDLIQAKTSKEVKRIASDLGLHVRSVTIAWTANPEEAAVVLRRQRDREEEARKHEHGISMRDVQRQTEATTFRLNSDLNVEKTRAANDFELQRLLLSNEITIKDLRDAAAQSQEARAHAHRLQMRLEDLKAELESAQTEFERDRLRIQIRKLESEILEKDTDRTLKVENDRHRRKMEIARYAMAALGVVALMLLLAYFLTRRTEPVAQPVTQARQASSAPESPANTPSGSGKLVAPTPTSTTTSVSAPETRGPATVVSPPSPPPALVNLEAVSAGRPLVLVVNAEGSRHGELTSVLARAFAGNGGAFLPRFLTNGFSTAHGGDSNDLRRVPGIANVPLILLAVSETTLEPNLFEGMRRASLRLDVRIFRPSNGFASDSVHVDAVGAGFSDPEATSNAAERIALELKRAVD